jgi:hypothetical protein
VFFLLLLLLQWTASKLTCESMVEFFWKHCELHAVLP